MVYTCLRGPDWTTPVLGDQDGLHLCLGTRMVYVLGDQDGLPCLKGPGWSTPALGFMLSYPYVNDSDWFIPASSDLVGLPCVKGLG